MSGPEVQPGHIRGATDLFERIGTVEAVFERIVVYPSGLLHASLLPNTPVSLDPRAGRLTINAIYRYETPAD